MDWAPRYLGYAGLTAIVVALLAYCLYLAGIARWFASRRLAVCFVSWLVALALLIALIVVAETSAVFWRLHFLPGGPATWKKHLVVCSGGMLFGMGLAWLLLVWRLRRLLPFEGSGYDPDED
jgi:hypothetical protein